MGDMDSNGGSWQATLAQRLATAERADALGETTLTIAADSLIDALTLLRDEFGFEQLVDLAGVDYAEFPHPTPSRFAVVYHLLSLQHNRRIRIRAFCPDDDFPLLASATPVWASANWYEREAFDLFGIVFLGHDDLRRILTDYGFIGHPFRKDFPISGHTEMRYDPDKKRVVYQPVSIPPREITPRTIREPTFGKEKADDAASGGADKKPADAAAKA